MLMYASTSIDDRRVKFVSCFQFSEIARYFPWDRQDCRIEFGSWTYDTASLTLEVRGGQGDIRWVNIFMLRRSTSCSHVQLWGIPSYGCCVSSIGSTKVNKQAKSKATATSYVMLSARTVAMMNGSYWDFQARSFRHCTPVVPTRTKSFILLCR